MLKIYGLFGLEAIRKCYPLVTHLPLVLALWLLQKRILCSVTAVLTAYLCCQLRRWISLLLIFFLGGGEFRLTVVQIVITTPLLWILVRFAKSPMRQLNLRKNREILQFMFLSLIYYIFDYVTTVYTDILYSGNRLVVEFMPFICCISYFVFIFYSSSKERELIMIEMERNQLSLQTKQVLQELSALRQSQEQAKEYRHDLRHHL